MDISPWEAMTVANPRHPRPTTVDHGETSIETRIGEHIKPQPNGCWFYNGIGTEYHIVYPTKGKRGDQHAVRAHRYVYETLVGPIPDGHELHHTCLNPGCCNPEHLVPLTPAAHKAEHAALRSTCPHCGGAL